LAAAMKKGIMPGRYTWRRVSEKLSLNTLAISRSFTSVPVMPSYTLDHTTGMTIRKDVTMGMCSLVRNRNSSIINEATGVARTILEMGERNASITFDLAVSMPMATPVTMAER